MRLRVSEFVIDVSNRRLRRQGKELKLSMHQWDFLEAIIKEHPETVPKKKVREIFQTPSPDPYRNVADFRARVGDTKPYRLIKTDYGKGYCLAGEPVRLPDPSHSGLIPSGPAVPQSVFWVPASGGGPGIRNDSVTAPVLPLDMLIPELGDGLLPQAVPFIEKGCTVAPPSDRPSVVISEHLSIMSPEEIAIAGIWFGVNPKTGIWDGRVRIGIRCGRFSVEVWQIYRRYSDGSYRLLKAHVLTRPDLA